MGMGVMAPINRLINNVYVFFVWLFNQLTFCSPKLKLYNRSSGKSPNEQSNTTKKERAILNLTSSTTTTCFWTMLFHFHAMKKSGKERKRNGRQRGRKKCKNTHTAYTNWPDDPRIWFLLWIHMMKVAKSHES